MGQMPARSARRAGYVVSGLSGFYSRIGMDDPPLEAPVIEAYCVIGLAERHTATRGTYRSVLRNVAGGGRPPVATRFKGSRAHEPYDLEDRCELWSVARSQPTWFRRHSAAAVLSLAMGAGLRTCEIVAARRHDIVSSGSGVNIQVGGERERVVPVTGEAADWLRRNRRGSDDDYLFHPEGANRGYHNFVNDFCRRLTRDPSSPYLAVARLRSSFVCDHLENATSLSELLCLTGIVEVESLIYYSRHVPGAPQSKAALRRVLAQGG
jgi:integrase